ncbi:hypothetical protein BC826DRAFT_985757 [Russula brevipes]|nr:hypothetical protein BC826DRAFT_985757 [Russula brevipes]
MRRRTFHFLGRVAVSLAIVSPSPLRPPSPCRVRSPFLRIKGWFVTLEPSPTPPLDVGAEDLLSFPSIHSVGPRPLSVFPVSRRICHVSWRNMPDRSYRTFSTDIEPIQKRMKEKKRGSD